MQPPIPLPSRYQVSGGLGRGGMGAVYSARDMALSREVAVKVLLPDSDPDRFLREARLAARLKSPYVVVVHDLLELPDGSLAIVMEKVCGRSLEALIDTGAVEEVLLERLMLETARGMHAAEVMGIVHRDFKPSNVLIEDSGCAKVTDFGLAKSLVPGVAEVGRTTDGRVAGTPLYMAPEQVEDFRAADTRSDVYSWGASFYHAAAGRPPFYDANPFALYYRHKTEPLVSLRVSRPALAPVLTDVIERSLAKAPGDRFQSFGDIISVLTDASAKPWDAGPDPLVQQYLEEYRQVRAGLLSGPCAPFEVQFPSGSTFTVLFGDITERRCDAIVSSDDTILSMSGGVSEAIRMAGGDAIPADAWKYVPVRRGGVVVSGAGALPCQFVFHAVTIEYKPREAILPTRDIILQLLAGCMYHADTLPVRTLALPLLGTGAGDLARDVCLDTIVGFFVRTLARGATSLERVELVLR